MRLPTPYEIKRKLPLTDPAIDSIDKARETVRKIITGKDGRLAVVLGPCSIHNVDSALEYAKRLKELSKKVENNFFLVMRVYLEKPRTQAGWKGLLYDPHLDGSNDIKNGLFLSRKLLVDLAALEIPVATEFLDPIASLYIEDLVTWGFIGARTSSSPTHRQLASSLPMPVGFKNSTDGSFESAINGVIASRSPQALISIDEKGKLIAKQSLGNRDSHIVLRGSSEAPNYDAISIEEAVGKQELHHISNRILIDCSHGNCMRQYKKQKEAFLSVVEQFASGNRKIMGMMLESHLDEGNQFLSEDVSALKPSVSVTDACLSWTSTKELILSSDALLSCLTVSSSSAGYSLS